MNRIGFVDLDTSHPRSFVKRINSLDGFSVAAVFDRGRIKGPEETESFCRDFDVECCESLDKLLSRVDGVMVLSVDWETHWHDIKSALETGIACYCDKPILTNVEEARLFVDLAEKSKTPVFGGSGWRWNEPIQAAHRENASRIVDHVFASAPNHRYYYGIHAAECILGLLGPGITWVRVERHDQEGSTLVTMGHRRGAVARMLLEAPFADRIVPYTVDGEPQAVTFRVDDIHDGICRTFCAMVKTGLPPAPPVDLVESMQIMFAVEESIQTGNRVLVNDAKKVEGVPSGDYVAKYREKHSRL